ncbi:MAG: DUF2141 domain-containing protein [Prolixibacteraceae bacterium]
MNWKLLLFGAILFTNSEICFSQVQLDVTQGEIQIQYENLRSTKGNIVVKLYDSSSPKFPDTKSAIAIKTVHVSNENTTVIFNNLPYGKYAFSTFHDENTNGVMDTNIIHFPSEGYAFSNNLKITFGPPSFEKACFLLNQEVKMIQVKLAY